MQDGLKVMRQKSEKKKRKVLKQEESKLPQIREDLFAFFDQRHKKFYDDDKMEFIDNAHLNMPELRL